jgi:uncharacterized membrane protein
VAAGTHEDAARPFEGVSWGVAGEVAGEAGGEVGGGLRADLSRLARGGRSATLAYKEICDMSDTIIEPGSTQATDRDDKLFAALNYGLFLIGNIIGITSILAVIIAYARRERAPHWLQSHYTFQIKSFWAALIGILVCTFMILTIILSPFGAIGLGLIWLWMLVRSVVGLIRLLDGRGHPDADAMWV